MVDKNALLARLNAMIAELKEVERQSMLKVYAIYKTNSDLALGDFCFETVVRDIAESKFVKLIELTGGEQNYILYERKCKEALALHLSPESKRLRGECQG